MLLVLQQQATIWLCLVTHQIFKPWHIYYIFMLYFLTYFPFPMQTEHVFLCVDLAVVVDVVLGYMGFSIGISSVDKSGS